jgi:hypothetical protein
MGYGTEMTGTACDAGNGFKDPRTGLCFENESIAKALGYDQPVNVGNTIVQVGSQGSFTQDGALVDANALSAPGADNAGYVEAARVQLTEGSTSDAQAAYNQLQAYVKSPAFTSKYGSKNVASPIGSAGGADTSPTAIVGGVDANGDPVVTQASAAADPGVQTTGWTGAGGLLQTYGGYILMAIVIVVGLILIATHGSGSHA